MPLREPTFMMTWKLWRALHAPPTKHPLFRFICEAKPAHHTPFMILLGPVSLSLLVAVFMVGIWHSPHLILPVLFNPAFAAAIGFLLFTGTLYGMIWATNISLLISRLRGEGKYDLLILSPTAPVITNWAICTGYLYRNQAFKRISQQRARITRMAIMLASAFILPLMLGVISTNGKLMQEVLSMIVHLMALATIFQIDHMQSSVIGSLVGLSIPYHTRGSTYTRLLAAISFLTLQITSYLAVWVLCAEMLPELYMLAGTPQSMSSLSLPLMAIVIFYLTRETIILALWHRLTHRLQPEQPRTDLLVI